MKENKFSLVNETVSEDTKRLLNEVLKRYGAVSSWKLSSLSHNEFSWKCARKGLSPSDNGNVKLTVEAMKVDAFREGKFLELYLKNKAWKADLEGETKVYLVKDKEDSIVLFFSIKCGLLYKTYQYDKLESDKREFVNMLIDAMMQQDSETLDNYYNSGMYNLHEMDYLFGIAHNRIDLKMEDKELQDSKYTLKVEESYPAIEIHHFCRNSKYELNIKLEYHWGLEFTGK